MCKKILLRKILSEYFITHMRIRSYREGKIYIIITLNFSIKIKSRSLKILFGLRIF